VNHPYRDPSHQPPKRIPWWCRVFGHKTDRGDYWPDSPFQYQYPNCPRCGTQLLFPELEPAPEEPEAQATEYITDRTTTYTERTTTSWVIDQESLQAFPKKWQEFSNHINITSATFFQEAQATFDKLFTGSTEVLKSAQELLKHCHACQACQKGTLCPEGQQLSKLTIETRVK